MNRSLPLFIQLALFVFFAIFLIYPITSVLSAAFLNHGAPTLEYIYLMLRTPLTQRVVLNSLMIAISVTLTVSIISIALALAFNRISGGIAKALKVLLLLPLISPPFIGVIGLKQIFGRFGSLNLLLLDLGVVVDPIDWLRPGNLIAVALIQTIHLVPLMYLTVSASLAGIDSRLEEAAILAGANRFSRLWRVTLPIAFPGIMAGAVLVFVSSFTELGTPLLLEFRESIPVQIYNMLSDINVNHVGAALVLLTTLISVALFCLSQSLLPKHQIAQIHVGAAAARKPHWYDWLIWPLIMAYLTLAALPQLGLLLTAFSKEWFMTPLPEQLTFSHFSQVFLHPLTTVSIKNSFFLSATATLFITILAGLIALLTTRVKLRFAWLLDVFSLLPLAVPGLVFAFGYVGGFSGTILDPRFSPMPLLLIAYTVRRMPMMVRSANAGFRESHPALSEAAASLGAGPLTIARRITLPLISRHLLAGALLTFTYSMTEVSDSLFLAREERYYPISKALYTLLGRPDGLELAAALGVLVTILISVLLLIAERLGRRR